MQPTVIIITRANAMKYSGVFLPVVFVCSSGSPSTACTLFAGKIWRERMPCDSNKLQYIQDVYIFKFSTQQLYP